jgi:hypothetical protein
MTGKFVDPADPPYEPEPDFDPAAWQRNLEKLRVALAEQIPPGVTAMPVRTHAFPQPDPLADLRGRISVGPVLLGPFQPPGPRPDLAGLRDVGYATADGFSTYDPIESPPGGWAGVDTYDPVNGFRSRSFTVDAPGPNAARAFNAPDPAPLAAVAHRALAAIGEAAAQLVADFAGTRVVMPRAFHVDTVDDPDGPFRRLVFSTETPAQYAARRAYEARIVFLTERRTRLRTAYDHRRRARRRRAHR